MDPLTLEHLDLLGCRDGASQDDLRRAFRQKTLTVHPDKDPTPGAHERFLELKAAYECVREEQRVPCNGHSAEAVAAREVAVRAAEAERTARENLDRLFQLSPAMQWLVVNDAKRFDALRGHPNLLSWDRARMREAVARAKNDAYVGLATEAAKLAFRWWAGK